MTVKRGCVAIVWGGSKHEGDTGTTGTQIVNETIVF
jgi:hypothetical protein